METNERTVRIRASAIPIDEELSLGQDVFLLVQGTVTQRLEKDNDDGSMDVCFEVKGIAAHDPRDL